MAPLISESEELARRHPEFRHVLAQAGPCDLRKGRARRPHFAELARMVCYQQLAGSAARAIHARFAALFDGHPTPEAVLRLRDGELRRAGLSASKAATITDLAARAAAGEIRLDRLGRLDDELVITQLTHVRGIGRWTAQMFLMFQLGRRDVWPAGDYGVRKGYAALFGLQELPTEHELLPLGEPFRPFRSVAAWYCWRAADVINP